MRSAVAVLIIAILGCGSKEPPAPAMTYAEARRIYDEDSAKLESLISGRKMAMELPLKDPAKQAESLAKVDAEINRLSESIAKVKPIVDKVTPPR